MAIVEAILEIADILADLFVLLFVFGQTGKVNTLHKLFFRREVLQRVLHKAGQDTSDRFAAVSVLLGDQEVVSEIDEMLVLFIHSIDLDGEHRTPRQQIESAGRALRNDGLARGHTGYIGQYGERT